MASGEPWIGSLSFHKTPSQSVRTVSKEFKNDSTTETEFNSIVISVNFVIAKYFMSAGMECN